jgi:threonine/homoserine/homoserine lactone efflux protein
MGSLLASLVPYGIAAACAAPVAAVVTALIIGRSPHPYRAGLLFILGAVVVDLVFVIVAVALLEAAGADTNSDIGAWIDALLGVLFLAVGVKALLSHPDADAEAAQREKIDTMVSSGSRALIVLGVLVQVINVDALAVSAGGLKEVVASGEPAGGQVAAIAFLYLLVLLPYWGPLAIYAVIPDRAGGILRSFSEWILDHSRGVEIVTGIAFGSYFLAKGLAALL